MQILFENYLNHNIYMKKQIKTPRIPCVKHLRSDIEIQKEFLKKQGIKLASLWTSEAYKTIRYVNFRMAGYKK